MFCFCLKKNPKQPKAGKPAIQIEKKAKGKGAPQLPQEKASTLKPDSLRTVGSLHAPGVAEDSF